MVFVVECGPGGLVECIAYVLAYCVLCCVCDVCDAIEICMMCAIRIARERRFQRGNGLSVLLQSMMDTT